ncbi:GNAT family N-acetyltransferase [Alkalicoccus daliensis]|uniref:Acetyltransferase (GNAT) family protein n=1 Tax=Alkalicoccus daliensis TaxID=745820 RepID=A0A1H0JKL1_9BACI|nr:GNAT family N-acetyltransferase [Alkalicoccus daliensis]SDO44154.1 Acetyltransferase (GNAT) family protein [Alkalicoccus daliensis]
MDKYIRRLTEDDYSLFQAMDTGIEDDYISHFFHRFIHSGDRIYGMFVEEQLAVMAGYSIYAENYAMLGRLRSDRRFQGKSLATELMTYVKQEALKEEKVHWVGGNTEEKNIPARRVLEKAGLAPRITQYAAVAAEVGMLESGAAPWQEITSPARKREWLESTYVKEGSLFPYQCYYPFPATAALFEEKELASWKMYENPGGTKFVLAKHDQKRTHYLHVGYPWEDFQEPGLWETITSAQRSLEKEIEEDTKVWLDLPKDAASHLPAQHPFNLSSIWVLHEAAAG